MFSQSLINEKIKTITILAEKSGYNKKIVKKLYEARINKLNEIESGQKEERKFTTTIPFDKGASVKLKRRRKTAFVCPLNLTQVFSRG